MLEHYWKKILRRERISFFVIPAFFLWLFSFVYRLAFLIRKMTSGHKLKLTTPVVCIGNITVGGTGKTSMVAFLCRFLLNEGYRVGIVSAGYGRAVKESFIQPGYKIHDMDVTVTGDEVKFLARLLPEAVFSVDESKSIAAQNLTRKEDVDLIIVDDGFQHFKLARELDIVTYDAGIKKNLLKMFPYGVLREPLSSLKRADVIVITRSNFAHDLYLLQKKLKDINKEAQHYHAQFIASELVGKNQTLPLKYLEDKSVFMFAGIGNFLVFKRQISALCADLDYAMELADHQLYTEKLLQEIKSLADKYDSDLILTTGKDWVKIEHFDFGREIYYLTQEVDLDPGEEKMVRYLQQRLKLRTRDE